MTYMDATGKGITAVLVASSTARPKIQAEAEYVCDGVSDHIDINDAIVEASEGGENWEGDNYRGNPIYLSEGVFTCSDQIDLTTAGWSRLSGFGKHSTALHFTHTDGTYGIYVSSGNDGGTIENMRIKGSYQLKAGIYLDQIYNTGTNIYNVHIGDCVTGPRTPESSRQGFGRSSDEGAGLWIHCSRYVNVRDCAFGDNYNGLKMTSTATPSDPSCVLITGSQMSHNANYGLVYGDTEHVECGPTVIGGTIQYNGGYGIYGYASASHISLIDVWLENNTTYDGYFSSGENLLIHLKTHTDLPFYLSNLKSAEISGFWYGLIADATTQNVFVKTGSYQSRMDKCLSTSIATPFDKTFNYCENGSIETDTTGWSGQSATISRETGTYAHGSACLKILSNGTYAHARYTVPKYSKLNDRFATVGFWARGEDANEKLQNVVLTDGGGTGTSTTIEKDTVWRWYTTTRADLQATVPYLYIQAYANNSGTSDTTDILYIDGVRLVQGNIVGNSDNLW